MQTLELGYPASGYAELTLRMVLNEVYALHFKTPATLPTRGKVWIAAVEYEGPQAGHYYELSPTAGDLSNAGDGEETAPAVTQKIAWFSPNTDYYFNLKIGNTSSQGPFQTKVTIHVPRA